MKIITYPKISGKYQATTLERNKTKKMITILSDQNSTINITSNIF
jgi:hypothetical protein